MVGHVRSRRVEFVGQIGRVRGTVDQPNQNAATRLIRECETNAAQHVEVDSCQRRVQERDDTAITELLPARRPIRMPALRSFCRAADALSRCSAALPELIADFGDAHLSTLGRGPREDDDRVQRL